MRSEVSIKKNVQLRFDAGCPKNCASFPGRMCRSCNLYCLKLFKGTLSENQMIGKIHIVTPIEKQIVSALENRFPLVDCTPQTRDKEKRSEPISVLISDHFYASSLANKGYFFRYCPSVVVCES